MTEALIALGANMPAPGSEPVSTLRRGLELLGAIEGISVGNASRWYRTPAWPRGSGPDFVNAAAVLNTGLAPVEVLRALHDVESRLGRTRPVRWAPRVCDLDLLGIGEAELPDRATVERWMALSTEAAGRAVPGELILPHPRLHERAFVLVPLSDVAPRWRHPILGRSVAEMIAELPAETLAEVALL